MGQKVRPTGFRTGIMTDWLSSWYASKQDFADLLVEDQKLCKILFVGVPVAQPVGHDAGAKAGGPYFLTHNCSIP